MMQRDSRARTVLTKDPSCICAWWPEEPNGWLINLSIHPVSIGGYSWPTVEHYYQCQKYPNNPEIIGRILSTPNPLDAKRIANDLINATALRTDWHAVKEEIMLAGLRAKVSQYPEIAQALIASGNKRIVEDSPDDYYWGCGRDGSGMNRLGALWEVVRAELFDRELAH